MFAWLSIPRTNVDDRFFHHHPGPGRHPIQRSSSLRTAAGSCCTWTRRNTLSIPCFRYPATEQTAAAVRPRLDTAWLGRRSTCSLESCAVSLATIPLLAIHMSTFARIAFYSGIALGAYALSPESPIARFNLKIERPYGRYIECHADKDVPRHLSIRHRVGYLLHAFSIASRNPLSSFLCTSSLILCTTYLILGIAAPLDDSIGSDSQGFSVHGDRPSTSFTSNFVVCSVVPWPDYHR